METKLFSAIDLKVTPATESSPGEISGYASTFGNVDRANEIVAKGAFAKTIKQFLANGFIGSGHNWGSPIGYPVEALEDDKGLFVRGVFHSTPDAQTVRQKMAERLAADKTVKLSIGYDIVKDHRNDDKVRVLDELELYEFSYVTVPANEDAAVQTVKTLQGLDLSLDGSVDVARVAVDDLRRRLAKLHEIRSVDGRNLSARRRDQLRKSIDQCTELVAELETLYAQTEPLDPSSRADVRKLRSAYLSRRIANIN